MCVCSVSALYLSSYPHLKALCCMSMCSVSSCLLRVWCCLSLGVVRLCTHLHIPPGPCSGSAPGPAPRWHSPGCPRTYPPERQAGRASSASPSAPEPDPGDRGKSPDLDPAECCFHKTHTQRTVEITNKVQ